MSGDVVTPAKRGDLALYRTIEWSDDGFTGTQGFVFALVTSVRRDGGAKRAVRGASVSVANKELTGLAFAVSSPDRCGFDVRAFVDATPDIFATPQDAQAAARKWVKDDSYAAKMLDAALAEAGQ